MRICSGRVVEGHSVSHADAFILDIGKLSSSRASKCVNLIVYLLFMRLFISFYNTIGNSLHLCHITNFTYHVGNTSFAACLPWHVIDLCPVLVLWILHV